MLYIDKRMSISMIAKTENCSRSRIRYWLKVYSLKTNPVIDFSKPKIYDALVCTKCKNNGTKEDFYSKGPNRISSVCKKCANKYFGLRWVKIKAKAVEYKGGKCETCGYCKYYGALQFHHISMVDKDVDWNKLRKRSWDKIIKELDKCMLLCANCHSEIHGQDTTAF